MRLKRRRALQGGPGCPWHPLSLQALKRLQLDTGVTLSGCTGRNRFDLFPFLPSRCDLSRGEQVSPEGGLFPKRADDVRATVLSVCTHLQ